MFLLPDGTFWIQLINFVVFYAILNVVFMRPVQRAIAKRREYIEGLTREYDEGQVRVSELRAEAVRVRSRARLQAEHTINEARGRASNEAASIASDYARRAQDIVEEARQKVQVEVVTARGDQTRVVADVAQEIISRVLPELSA